MSLRQARAWILLCGRLRDPIRPPRRLRQGTNHDAGSANLEPYKRELYQWLREDIPLDMTELGQGPIVALDLRAAEPE